MPGVGDVAGVLFGRESSAALLRELARNPALLAVCGFDPLGRPAPPRRTLARGADGRMEPALEARPRCDRVPTVCAFPQFLSGVVALEEGTGAVSEMVDALRRRLMEELPGCGRHLGYDGEAVPSWSTERTDGGTGRISNPEADWGRHGTHGVGACGKAWTKVKRWFGCGLRLTADIEHEPPVWFEVTRASRSEHKVLAAGLDGLFGSEPERASRCGDFLADRGLDGGPVWERLWDGRRIRPLIGVQELRREERAELGRDPSRPIPRSLAADGGGNVLRSGKGEVSCRRPATGGMRPMAFQGFEADRGILRHRYPAAACGLDCAGREAYLRDAGSKAGGYRRVAHIGLAGADRRTFTPTSWSSPSWRRGYARRGALERINARLDNSFGFERRFVRGGRG